MEGRSVCVITTDHPHVGVPMEGLYVCVITTDHPHVGFQITTPNIVPSIITVGSACLMV